MSFSLTTTSHLPKPLPSLSPPSKHKKLHLSIPIKASKNTNTKATRCWTNQKSALAIQIAAILATGGAVEPALAVTGVNGQEDLIWILIQSGISAFLYFIVFPPILMNWLRIRWYRRNLLEMYVQFMCVFINFPGLVLWAPFLNFRKLPQDPSMKYPWSVPEDSSKGRNIYRKYPWATPEDYD
nr:NAD(P)H-quinone oxidoreductase subunit L, chloroplastic [Ipomoea batatas]